MARRVYAKEYYMQGASSSKTQWVLPIRWMAPESYFDGNWDMRSDVWMFGVLLWEMFSWAELPWQQLQDGEIMKAVQNREKLKQPALCPEALYEVMLSCWRLDVQTRPTAAEIATSVVDVAPDEGSRLKWPGVIKVVTASDSSKGNELEELEVAADSIEVQRVLGSGEFGEVMLATLTRGSIKLSVAVKMLKESAAADSSEKFRLEAQLLSSLHHPHIVEVKAVCFDTRPHFMALELMTGGDLQEYLKTRSSDLQADPGACTELLGVVIQIAEAMTYLERKRIVHRDLAARNVLVGSVGLANVKLSDLGMSRALSKEYYRKTKSYKGLSQCMRRT